MGWGQGVVGTGWGAEGAGGRQQTEGRLVHTHRATETLMRRRDGKTCRGKGLGFLELGAGRDGGGGGGRQLPG